MYIHSNLFLELYLISELKLMNNKEITKMHFITLRLLRLVSSSESDFDSILNINKGYMKDFTRKFWK